MRIFNVRSTGDLVLAVVSEDELQAMLFSLQQCRELVESHPYYGPETGLYHDLCAHIAHLTELYRGRERAV